MATEVIMPKVDMVMETGTFVEWLVKEGGQASKGDPLFVIITEKAAIEVESPADGILAGVTAKPDDVIPVTQTIAYILAPGEELPSKAAPQPAAPSPSPVKSRSESRNGCGSCPSVGSDKVRATPVARRMAEELGVELSQIPGVVPTDGFTKPMCWLIKNRKRPAATSPSVPAVSTPIASPHLLPLQCPSASLPFHCRMHAASR